MKQRTKAEMAKYQRNRRLAKKKATQDAPQSTNDVTPDTKHPENVTPVTISTLNVTPVCNTVTLKGDEQVTPTIDYEGRRKDWEKQGTLSRQYSVIKSDFDKPGKLANYLGVDKAEPIRLKDVFPVTVKAQAQ